MCLVEGLWKIQSPVYGQEVPETFVTHLVPLTFLIAHSRKDSPSAVTEAELKPGRKPLAAACAVSEEGSDSELDRYVLEVNCWGKNEFKEGDK